MKYHLYSDNYKIWQPHEIWLKTDKFNVDKKVMKFVVYTIASYEF